MKIAGWLSVVLTVAAYPASIHWDFEGGAIEKAEAVSPARFRIAVKGETDQNGRNRQATWYYFRVDDAPQAEMTFDITGLPGEYNYAPNRGAITGDTPPVISYDRRTWGHVAGCSYDSKEPKLSCRIRPKAAQFWIAHVPPYTTRNLEALRKDIRRSAAFQEETIGTTPGGRPIYLWTIESPGPQKTVWLMFRQHSWESGNSWVGEGAVRALVANPPKQAGTVTTWKILPMCDPDGVARGGVRFNAKGYDLNRNWDVEDAALMPEITAQRNAVRQWLKSGHKINLFLSLHNTETNEYLEGPPIADNAASIRHLGDALFTALVEKTTFNPARPLSYAAETTTKGMPGRMDVAQGLYRDFRLPAFLMEQRIAFNSKLGRLPEIPDRLEFGRQLVSAIAASFE